MRRRWRLYGDVEDEAEEYEEERVRDRRDLAVRAPPREERDAADESEEEDSDPEEEEDEEEEEEEEEEEGSLFLSLGRTIVRL